MQRVVHPELLDELPSDDPRAIRSRKDLRRLNRIMGHARMVATLLRRANFHSWGKGIVDLGAGDGAFLLSVAPHLPRLHAVLVDKRGVIDEQVFDGFRALGWSLEGFGSDVFETLSEMPSVRGPAAIANLFLHHFCTDELKRLLQLIAERVDLFIACEPRRSGLALAASRLVRCIGCNHVTRHDAVASVRAGFADHELTDLWKATDWQIEEGKFGLFSHYFFAARKHL